MTTRDIMNSVDLAQVIAPQSASSEVTGSSVDLQGYDAVSFCVAVGTISSDTHGIVVEESDNDSDWSTAADDDVQGSPTTDLNTENTTYEIGYTGYKRYVRLRLDGNGGSALVSATAIKGYPHVKL